MTDLDAIRLRALANGQLIDMDVISRRVRGGDSVFAGRVLITALIKSNDEVRNRVLEILRPEDMLYGYRQVFDWSVESLRVNGCVEPATLYQRMQDYVHTVVGAGYHEWLARMLAFGEPTVEEVAGTVSWIRQRDADEHPYNSADSAGHYTTILAILARGRAEARQQMLSELEEAQARDVDLRGPLGWALYLAWAIELCQTRGQVDKESMEQKVEEYLSGPMMRNMTAVIDYVLALDEPSPELLEAALACVLRYRLRKAGKERAG